MSKNSKLSGSRTPSPRGPGSQELTPISKAVMEEVREMFNRPLNRSEAVPSSRGPYANQWSEIAPREKVKKPISKKLPVYKDPSPSRKSPSRKSSSRKSSSRKSSSSVDKFFNSPSKSRGILQDITPEPKPFKVYRQFQSSSPSTASFSSYSDNSSQGSSKKKSGTKRKHSSSSSQGSSKKKSTPSKKK